MNENTNVSDNMEIQDPSLNYNEDDFIDFGDVLRDIISNLIRFWYVVVIIMILFGSLAYLYQKKSYVPSYKSSATVIINTNYGLSYSSTILKEKIMALVVGNISNVVTNGSLDKLVAKELGLPSVPGTFSADGIADTNMFKITCTAASAQMSYDILQAVIKKFPEAAEKMIGTTVVTVVDESGVPKNPDTVFSYQLLVLAGIAGGFVLYCIFVAMYSLLKTTIRKENDFPRVLDIECLGGIPKVVFSRRNRKEKRPVLTTERGVGYDFCESYLSICTRLERDQKENDAKVYVISSTLPQEGKSTFALNLAYTFAEIGKKVVLLDMDIRNPSIAKILEKDNSGKSLQDILEGNAEYEDVVIPLDNRTVSVIPGSDLSASVNSVLLNPNIKLLIEKARECADVVLVDVASVGLFSDVTEIAAHADGAIYVVSQDFVPAMRIKEGIEMLSQCGTRIVGGVLNKAIGGYNNYIGSYGEEAEKNTRKKMVSVR